MSNRIEEIEREIIIALRKDPLQRYCSVFETYDVDPSPENIRDLIGKLPACLVSYVGDQFEEVTHGSTYMVDGQFSVLVIAEMVRGDEGIYSMIEDVKSLLHLSNLDGYQNLPIILKQRAPIEVAPGVAIYELLFQIQFVD